LRGEHIKVSILATDFTDFFAFFVYICVASWIFFFTTTRNSKEPLFTATENLNHGFAVLVKEIAIQRNFGIVHVADHIPVQARFVFAARFNDPRADG